MTRLSFIPAQFIKCAQDQRDDLDRYVVAGIHIALGSSAGVGRAWVVNADGTDGGELHWPNSADKDDSISIKVLNNGSVRIVWCQAAPGGGGATSQPDAVVIPDVFPPHADYRPAIDDDCRWQANQATNMAHAAQRDADALETQMAALTARVEALETDTT